MNALKMQGGCDQAGNLGWLVWLDADTERLGQIVPVENKQPRIGLIWLELKFFVSLFCFNLHVIVKVPLTSVSVRLGPDPAHANTPSCVPAWETTLLLCWALKTTPFLMSASAPLPPAGHGWTYLAFRAAPWRWSRIKLRASEQLYRKRGQ